jgi:integrase
MAWSEPMYDKEGKIKGYRGRYRDAKGIKQKVLDPDGQLFKRPKAAKDAAAEKEVEARRHATVDVAARSAGITWGKWWDIVSVDRTFESDNDVTEHYVVKLFLRPYWGDTPLNSIDQKAVQDWVNSLAAGTAKEWTREHDKGKPGARPRPPRPSPGYVQRIYSVFSVSMQLAVDAKPRVLVASPCVGIKLPRRVRKQKQYLPVSEAKTLGANLKEHYRDAVDFALEVGTRPGELCGMHVDQIDRELGIVWMTNVMLTHSRQIRSFPKDGDARRFPLTKKALEIFERRTHGRDLTAGCGVPHLDGSECKGALLFVVLPRGIAMNPNVLGARMRDAAKKAGLPRRGSYALRRGFATRLAQGGVNVFELADALGHEDISLVRGYVQETPGARERLLAALGESQPLHVIEGGGARGADVGADSSLESVEDRGILAEEDAG